MGLGGATALNMIDMIGVGPFITIPLIVSAMGGPQAMLGWIVGALLAMCGGAAGSALAFGLLRVLAAVAPADVPRLNEAGVDALIISTCTGYLCPGLSSYATEALELRSDVLPLDLVGQGCDIVFHGGDILLQAFSRGLVGPVSHRGFCCARHRELRNSLGVSPAENVPPWWKFRIPKL